jgi:phosphoribosylformylglycinamidine cyclo-ligase
MKYEDAGVDRTRGYDIVERIREYTRTTHNAHVLESVGGFGALYRLGAYRDPVLVSGTDGVGTKLHIARSTDRLEGIGIDCVAMCVNDILCHGARPLFFLDYLAYCELSPEQVARIVKGVADGCREAGCALVGGENAEMPGTYQAGDFDIAGFAVGVAERDSLVDGRSIEEGDALVGLQSSGLHSNGFSLVRALLEAEGLSLDYRFNGTPLFRSLLAPTRIYASSVLPLLEAGMVKGLAHITGGGLFENVPRMFPEEKRRQLTAVIRKGSWQIDPIFSFVQDMGVEEEEMYHTFNMGVGMVLAVDTDSASSVVKQVTDSGIEARVIGSVEYGEPTICIE